MKIPQLTFMLLCALTCVRCADSDKPQTVSDTSRNNIKKNTAVEAKSAPVEPRQQIVTDRMLNIAKVIDSLGFRSDTARRKQVAHNPTELRGAIIHEAEQFHFYEVAKVNMWPYRESSEYVIDKTTLDKTERIMQYFFTGGKNTIDGIIEEWKFPDNISAKLAAETIERKVSDIYFNVGAFICCTDNYMYIFTTRASGFMYSIKPMFVRFVKDNDATVISTNTWYSKLK